MLKLKGYEGLLRLCNLFLQVRAMVNGLCTITAIHISTWGWGLLGILNVHPIEPVDKTANLAGSNMSDF